MQNPIPTDLFITTLTEVLLEERDLRATDLARHSKEQAARFARHRSDSTAAEPQRARSLRDRTHEAPDCVSFFSNTLKGATP